MESSKKIRISKSKKDKLKSFLFINIGVMISSFAFSFFLNPSNVVIGGVSGAAIIFKELNNWDPSVVMFVLNAVLLLMSLLFVGKDFFFKTIYGALMFPVYAKIFDEIYKLLLKIPGIGFGDGHMDIILVIIFSSIIMGYGLGLAVKYGASTGGTEIPQKILHKTIHMPYSLSLYLIDGSIILLGFFLLGQDIDILLYEIIFVILCGFIMDTTVFSGFNKRAVYVISERCDEIIDIILKDFERGVTGMKVVGEYSKQDKKMIICLLSSLEYYKLRDIIEKIDPKAFLFCVRASEVRGEGFTYGSEDF